MLPVVNASLAFFGFYVLLDRPQTDWAQPWVAVVFAAFYLLLLRLPAGGLLKRNPPALESLHLAAAVVFLTLAIPLKAHDRWLTIGWLVEGAALLWVAARVRSQLLKALAVGCLVLGLGALLLAKAEISATPVFNSRFATYCVAIAVFALAAWIAYRGHDPEEAGGLAWPAIAGASVLIVNFLILLSVGLEIHSYWWRSHWSGDWHELRLQRMAAEFSYSAWFMLFAAVLLVVGFGRRSAFLRWQGLVLLALSVGKVFLVDTNALSQGYRIVSFLVLGVLLLGVSFAYQRDWLKLREGLKP